MTRAETEETLLALQNEKYRAFHSGLVPGLTNLCGVRMPALRKLAREIIRGDWEGWLADPTPDRWYEETMLRGIVLASAPMTESERLQRLAEFVPQITNWAICDCVCATLRLRDRAALRTFLQPYLTSTEEFPARFGAVLLLRFFVEDAELERTVDALCAIPAEGYNARMGAAWALAECIVKYPERTLDRMEQNAALPRWTRHKALQKALESRRLPECVRERVRALRAGCRV